MSNNLGWRGAIIAFLIVMAFIYLTPTLSKDLPQWWSVLPDEEIQLGLDLQGGMHLVLEVEAEKAVETDTENDMADIKQVLREKKIRYLGLRRNSTHRIEITLMRENDRDTFEDLIKSRFSDYAVSRVDGQEKGLTLMLTLDEKAKSRIMKMATDQALETIRNRIDEFGVREPDIRPQEGHRILIQLPGVKDPNRAIELIGRTAQLEFKLVDDENSLQEAINGNVPSGREILYELEDGGKGEPQKKIPYLLKKRTALTGKYITDARVEIDSRYSEPYVALSFNNKGARIFERVTGENIKKRMAIVLDGNIYSAPVIQDKISGGTAQITGRFTMDDARDLAIVLRAGALPAPVKILEERTVGPSLGQGI